MQRPVNQCDLFPTGHAERPRRGYVRQAHNSESSGRRIRWANCLIGKRLCRSRRRLRDRKPGSTPGADTPFQSSNAATQTSIPKGALGSTPWSNVRRRRGNTPDETSTKHVWVLGWLTSVSSVKYRQTQTAVARFHGPGGTRDCSKILSRCVATRPPRPFQPVQENP